MHRLPIHTQQLETRFIQNRLAIYVQSKPEPKPKSNQCIAYTKLLIEEKEGERERESEQWESKRSANFPVNEI